MAIYIQSRGKNQDQDYLWLRIKSNEYYQEVPEFFQYPIGDSQVKPTDLIESQKPSIILVATPSNYCLLVTALKARKERSDFTGRPVRNSILWICKKDSENILIRSLLIRALRGELDNNIDRNIEISGEHGFEVNYKQLKDFSNSSLAIENYEQIDSNLKIGKNCESLRREIAVDLENNALPNKEGLLVLITSIKSASALKKTDVWRGLSNRVESKEFEKYNSFSTVKPEATKKILGLWIAIALVSIIAIAILIKIFSQPQSQPQINPPQQIEQSKSQIQKSSFDSPKIQLNSIN